MARILDSVKGHESTISTWLEKPERRPHTAVFSGPRGVGKFTSALGLIQATVCPVSDQGCGTCGSCRRIENQQSESLLIIEPTQQQIKLDAAKQIIRFMNLKGAFHAVLIDQAHLLNVQAANALLKTLEEPPEDSLLILITDSPHALLGTIRSRAQFFPFTPLSDDKMKALFPNESEETLHWLRGRPGMQAEWDKDDWNDSVTSVVDFFEAANSNDLSKISQLAKTMGKDKDVALRSLTAMQMLLRDHFRMQNGSRGARFADHASQIQSWGWTDDAFRKISLNLYESERSLSSNVDRQLIFENIAIFTQSERSS